MFEFFIRDLFYYFQLNIGIISIAFNRVRIVAFRSASFSCKFSLNTFIIHIDKKLSIYVARIMKT